ncbi:MAG: ABC transporter permease [Bacteroidota bacterium]|nr:ABC transporter permease [Bacteroidota bacterium]
MLRSYFIIAWRTLIRQKQFTILNLLGLSTGLACVLLIFLWVNDEWQVDRFSKKDSQLYEVLKRGPDGTGSVQVEKYTQGLLAQAMAADLPEVEYAVPVRKDDNRSILSSQDKHLKVKHEFAGKDFFKVFSYPLISGAQADVSGVSSVFISDEMAMKLFHTTDVAGKTIDWEYTDDGVDYSGPYAIAGVFSSPPASASNQFDLLVPFDLYAKKNAGGLGDVGFWGSNMVSTYAILKKGTHVDAFNNKIKDFSVNKIKSIYPGKDLASYEGELFARRYSDAYLHSNFVNGKPSGGRIEYVRLFSIIALFVLVIACINFMNLSTAKAAGRMKEVGVRKVAGAPRRSIVFQYLVESVLLSLTAMVLAVVLAYLMLPAFSAITGKTLFIPVSIAGVAVVLGLVLVTGILAGSYPALYLSRFRPAMVLKGKFNTPAGESILRKGLVVFQFFISVVLIIAVVVVQRQMKLIQTINLGYDKDHVIHFSAQGKLRDHPEAFMTEIRKIPGVLQLSSMEGDLLGHAGHSGGGISWVGKDPGLNIEYYGISGDYGYPELLGMKIAQGRSFSPAFGMDSNSVMFNEAAVAAMGIRNPVGKTVSLWGRKKQIIGVVKDFHFESLHKKTGPAFLEYSPVNETLLVKIRPGGEAATLSRLERLYKSFSNGLVFEYAFLDEDYQALYASEQKVAVLSRYFATVAIIISCLGLFGLAAFTAQKRQKEIGIRKVVGASVTNIALMLSGDFLKLVLLALLIAFPVAWLVMNNWLQGFAYRVYIHAGVFLTAGAAVAVITAITVSFQAIKAAVANPAKSLRSE